MSLQYTPSLTPARVRPIDLSRLLDDGCDLTAQRGTSDQCLTNGQAADGIHDRALDAVAHLSARWTAMSAANGCGCDAGFTAIGRQNARAQAADAVEDAWIYDRLAGLLDRVWSLGRAINGGLERAARALRGGAR